MAAKTKSTQLILALMKLESRRTVKYWGPLSFDLIFTRLKFTSRGICSLCNRELRFRDFVQNSAVPFSPLRRLREWTWLKTCHPPELWIAQDRKRYGMLTGNASDCGPQPVGTSSTLGWSEIAIKLREGGQWHGAASRLLMLYHQNLNQNVILWCCVCFKKDSQEVSAGTGI